MNRGATFAIYRGDPLLLMLGADAGEYRFDRHRLGID